MRKYTKPPRVEFADRQCSEPGCRVQYAPSGPNAKYCPDHSDARLRASGRWRQLRERSARRAVTGDRCECCGNPAHGASYHGVVCCDQCRTDAVAAGREWLEDHRARERAS